MHPVAPYHTAAHQRVHRLRECIRIDVLCVQLYYASSATGSITPSLARLTRKRQHSPETPWVMSPRVHAGGGVLVN